MLNPTRLVSCVVCQNMVSDPFPSGLFLLHWVVHDGAQTEGSCVGFGTSGQLSQASPTPSPSRSACRPVPGSRGFGLSGPLSQTSPTPSKSRSARVLFGLGRQLSPASPAAPPSAFARPLVT